MRGSEYAYGRRTSVVARLGLPEQEDGEYI